MILRWKTALATLALTALPVAAFAEDAVSTPVDATADVSADVAGDATGTTGGTCKGNCGAQDDAAACYCDDICQKSGDCCPDFQQQCPDLWQAPGDPNIGKTTCAGGCGKYFGEKSAGACNCDVACSDPKYNDCCPDVGTVCAAAADGVCAAGQCTGIGKSKAGKDSVCLCDPQCTQMGSCCTNFDEKGCGGSTGGDTGTTADVTSCIAKCSGKKCGEDDGCGVKCAGTCDAGFVCNNSKTCVSTSGTSDVSTAKDSGSLDATGGTGADTGTAGPTGTTGNGNNNAKASGCTSSSSSNGSWGLALALFGLIGAIVLRRRSV